MLKPNPWNAAPANQYKEPVYQQPKQNFQQNFTQSPYYPDPAIQPHTYKPTQPQQQMQVQVSYIWYITH